VGRMDFVMFTGVKIVYESKINDSQDKKRHDSRDDF